MSAGMGHPQPPWATCSVHHHPMRDKLPPHIQPKPPLSQLKTIPPHPITIHPHKQPFPLLFLHSLQVLGGHHEVSPEPSLPQDKQARFPQPSPIGEAKKSFGMLYLPWQNSSLSGTEAVLALAHSFQGGSPSGPSFPLPPLTAQTSLFEGQRGAGRPDGSEDSGKKQEGKVNAGKGSV